MPEPGSVAHHALTGTLAVLEDGTGPRHVLAGYTVAPGTLLEVRLAPTASEPMRQESVWLPIRYEAHSPVGLWATWLLAVDTSAGRREMDLRLPPDAVLRWPPQAPVVALREADYTRLAALADQLERSYAALDHLHQDPRSGIPDLARGLFRLDSAAWAGLARVLRVWAEQRRRLCTDDLVLLEGLAQDLERAVATLRQQGRSGLSDNTRSVIQHESGQLLLESGWLRDLCRRVSQPGSQ